jgi:hypothetical protein
MRFRLALTVLCFLLCSGPRGVGAEKSRFERLDAKVEDVGNESTKVELKGKMWAFPISRRRAEEAGLKPGVGVIALWDKSGETSGASRVTGLEFGGTTLHAGYRKCTETDCPCTTAKCKPSCGCPKH